MQTISAQEYQRKYGTPEQKKQGYISRISDKVKQSIQGTADRNVEITQGTGEYQNQGNIRRGFELAGNTARGIFDATLGVGVQVAGEDLGNTKLMQNIANNPKASKIVEDVARPLADPIGSAGNQLGKSDYFQQAAEGIDQNPNSFAAKTESGLSVAKNVGDVANVILVADQIAKYGNRKVAETKAVAKDIYSKVKSNTPTPSPGGQGEGFIQGIKNDLVDSYGEQIKADWERPAKTPNASYSKATKIYEKAQKQGHDVSDTLIKNKLDPQSMTEQGKYSTTDTATKLRSDANKTSHDMLRPSLEQADNFTPRTPVEDIIRTAAKKIQSNTKLTPGTKTTLLKSLQAEYQALKAQYPEGMKLSDLHDGKITYDANAKYSPVGDVATNNVAIKNKVIADAHRTLLEQNAPKGIPVKEFNAELAKQHQAASYLEALNNKKVPMTMKSRIFNTAAKVGGAAVGHGMGGGILGGVGGYHIGGMIESLLEGLPNPLREQFLANLKVSNPEAFSKISEFLQQQATEQATRKALPPPSYMEGQPRTYPESKVEVLPAQKQIYRDPKTGQMKKGYTSQSGETIYPKGKK